MSATERSLPLPGLEPELDVEIPKDHCGPRFEEVVQDRLSRRSLLRGLLAGVPLMVVGTKAGESTAAAQSGGTPQTGALGFRAINLNTSTNVVVPPGYNVSVVVGWGDPLLPGAPAFDMNNQTAAAQAQQFGFNADWVGFYPLPDYYSGESRRGLLAVNHEYTTPTDMFTTYQAGSPTKEQVDIEIAAHGVSVVEVQHTGDQWVYLRNSPYNRRLTGETVMEITGPARGEVLMRTAADPTGTRVRGTLNNCAGGWTPWGTALTAEENFHQYFANRNAAPAGEVLDNHTRYGVGNGPSSRRWENYHDRFDIAKEPNELFRFGWMVEFDPYDPNSVPKKRTAMGRVKHEGATPRVTNDGRVTFYTGDDERFDYVYKFVTAGAYNRNDRAANADLLDEGTLYAARFNADGTGEWLPLVFGQGPLTPENGFRSQGDVLIKTRFAADRLGATRMDRPEDIETNPITGKVYVLCTNNTARTAAQVDAANPRANNQHGHIVEIREAGDDAGATTFTWEIFMLCGDPKVAAHGTFFANFDPARVSPISCPDNLVFDLAGNMWIGTDGQEGTLQGNDGVYAVPTEGAERGYVRQFLSVPAGAEVCGPEFSPDNTTFFCAVQHPGEGGGVPNRIVRWPDNTPVARPAVLAVIKAPGAANPVIGS